MKDIITGASVFSIRPKYISLILEGQKIYEFRNKLPKKLTDFILVYESGNVKSLNYIFKIGKPIEFPTIISDKSYGVDRFNSGEMDRKYAIPILKVYTFEGNPEFTYTALKSKFGFYPPQSFMYLSKNPELFTYILNRAFKLNLIRDNTMDFEVN